MGRSELENVKTTRQLFVEDFSIREGNETKSETKQELEELRSRQLNRSSNVAKVRQELTGNAIMTKTETDESSLQDGKVNKEPAPARGRKREFKSSKEKEKNAARSKSLSSIKNAGNKLKSFANEKLKSVMKNNQKL